MKIFKNIKISEKLKAAALKIEQAKQQASSKTNDIMLKISLLGLGTMLLSGWLICYYKLGMVGVYSFVALLVGNLIIITKGEKLILNYNNNKLGLKHQEQELINLLEDEKEQKIIIDYLNMILLNHPDPTIYQLIYGAKDWLLKKNYENAANWLCPLLPHIQDYSINYENLISQSEQEKLLGVNNLLIEDEIEIENYRSML